MKSAVLTASRRHASLRRSLALLVLTLGACAWAQDGGRSAATAEAPPEPPATLPAVISTPSPTRGVTVKYYLALESGRLWLKRNPGRTVPDTADAGYYTLDQQATDAWKPLDGTGIPVVDGVPTPVTEVSMDDERMIAVAEDGDLIRFEEGVWTRPWGLPLPMPGFLKPLQLPSDVFTWTLSMRHRQVLYYEDPKGNQFNFGNAGCTTVFALRGDGSRIAQGDPWFPPDFSRELCGPRRGTFRSVGLASSASVTMVIDGAGTLFTRFSDYDANGGTPFFVYRYTDFEKQPLPGTDPLSENQVRALPEPGWTEEPRIPSEGKTRLTRRIAVLQNGHGNLTRELRVVAKGPSGATGYFVKELKDPAWRFVETGEPIAEADFIENDASRTVSAPSRDRFYFGAMTAHDRPVKDVAYAVVPDLNFHCGPAHLVLVTASGKSVPFTLHLVDSWSLFENQDPEDTPQAYKTHKVTVEVPKDVQDSTDPEVRALVDRYFPDVSLRAFKFELIANQGELLFFPVGYPLRVPQNAFELRLRAPSVDRRIYPYREKYKEYVANPDTCVPPDVLGALLADRQELSDKIAVARGLWAGLPTGLSLADIVSVVTTTRWTVNKLKTLGAFEEHLPGLTSGMQTSLELYRDRSFDDYQAVRTMLQSRLCSSESVAEKREVVPAADGVKSSGGRGRGGGGGLPPGM